MRLQLPPDGSMFAFDFETIPDTYVADIISFAWFRADGEFSVSYEIEKLTDLEKQAIFNTFDKARGVIAHNVTFDLRVLRAWGYPINRLEGRIHDTMLMVAVEDTEQEKKLGACAKRVGMVKRDWDEARHNREEYLKYASDDSLICLKLFEHMRGVLSRLDIWSAYNLEIEMVWCLIEMYDYGISIDLGILDELTEESERKRKQFMIQLIDLAGYTLNLNSTKQLRELIYDHWKIEPNTALLTGKGDTSTGKEAIHEISMRLEIPENVKEFCRQLLEYKSYTKLASTFLGSNFKSHIHPDGKIRSDIGSVFTRTARLNSSNPNCQNIPARGNGASIRKMFVASEGNLLIVADQSQLEYRILAHYSNDPALMNPYINDPDTDIHDIVSKLLGLPRWAGKNMNFASVYGQKATSLAKKSNISVAQANSFLAEYDRRFPGVRKYVSGAEAFARANNYCIMPSGRRRSLGQYAGQGGSLERNGVNTPIQGAASEIMKVCMIAARKTLPKECKMILQVHDELLFDCPEELVPECIPKVKEIMEHSYKLNVPLLVEPEASRNWKEAKGD